MTKPVSDELDIKWPPGVSDEERAELLRIVQAFDGALAEFENDRSTIFPSDADRLRLFHASRKRRARDWDRPGPCMYPGCTNHSIVRSHSIPMSATIKLISEDGHVVGPKMTSNGAEVCKFGIREASTFPGFCKEHELVFSEFETAKEISTERHYALQAFRTLCREIFRVRHNKQNLETEIADYRQLRDEAIAARIRRINHSESINVTNITFNDDAVEGRILDFIEHLSNDLTDLEGIYKDLSEEIFLNRPSKVSFMVTQIDLQLPVCMSGLGVLNYIEHGIQKRALSLLAIIPEKGLTKLIYGSADTHINALRLAYADHSSTAILAMVESWMCHGSDHWFMTPSEWSIIADPRKEATLDLILNANLSIADPVEFSILDSARRTIIQYIEEALSSCTLKGDDVLRASALLAQEKEKLAAVPARSAEL